MQHGQELVGILKWRCHAEIDPQTGNVLKKFTEKEMRRMKPEPWFK